MTQSISDYTVESEHSNAQLETKVRARLKEGWEPLGGVQVVAPGLNGAENALLYVQSLVKREPAK